MASKIKKALKKIGKAALVAGAGYAAFKGLKNRKKGTDSTNADAIKKMTSNAAYSDDTMPSNLSKNTGKDNKLGAISFSKRSNRGSGDYGEKPAELGNYVNYMNYRKDGGRAELKGGGKVKGCGKALRGFGKAMKKGNR